MNVILFLPIVESISNGIITIPFSLKSQSGLIVTHCIAECIIDKKHIADFDSIHTVQNPILMLIESPLDLMENIGCKSSICCHCEYGLNC